MAFNKAKAMQEAEKLVGQRKNLEAIKQYSMILERDPTDLALLNTIGDLYYREKNTSEALKSFNKLGDAFMKDGFTVKAIAIFKKVTKIDSNAVDSVLKLAELYILQGLAREAREQYAQAVDYFKRKNQPDRALDVFHRIVLLDPANLTYRTKLAEFAEQLGKKLEAGKAYLELAEAAITNGDVATANKAIKKASELDPKNSHVQVMQARLALKNRDYAQVEKIVESIPDLRNNPQGRQLLLESYLATQKLEQAEKLVSDVFRADPSNFSPLASFASLCMETDKVDAALVPLSEAVGVLIERKETSPLMDVLRQMWAKFPQHLAVLELVRQVCEKTSDEAALPEVLEALGSGYEQAGDLEKAEGVYEQLVKRSPTNEEYRSLLNGIRQKLGKEVGPPSAAALAEFDLAGIPEAEPVVAEPAVDNQQEAMLKEALENSDLFSRYGLIDKAITELEKVLADYPDQVDIHRRIFEISHRTNPARATQAASALADILKRQGDLEGASKYEALSRGAPAEEVAPPPLGGPVTPVGASVAGGPAPVEVDLSDVFSSPVTEEVQKEVPLEVPLDLTGPPPAPPQEMDLSTDFAAFTGAPAAPETPPAEAPPTGFNYQEAREEIEFYVGQGFMDEARNAVQAWEEKLPGNAQVAELRRIVEGGAEVAAPTVETPPAAPSLEALPAPIAPPPIETVPPPSPAPVEARPVPSEPPPPPPSPEPAVVAAGPAAPPEAPTAGSDMLGSLVGDLEAGLEGFGTPAPPSSAKAQPGGTAEKDADGDGASQLSGLLDELGEGAGADTDEDDPDKHYNLGVAFREMGLLDEAIGEFQKVVKGAQKDHYPPNFLQACSLLALCFSDKGMPAIAAKWYIRALETPGLNEESVLALQYDLGVAYEQAGDTRTALEKFSEVYSQNIDFRDVAEKIRTLQQKAR